MTKEMQIKKLVDDLLQLLSLEDKNKLIGFLKAQILTHSETF